jgi:hypothetical protein
MRIRLRGRNREGIYLTEGSNETIKGPKVQAQITAMSKKEQVELVKFVLLVLLVGKTVFKKSNQLNIVVMLTAARPGANS